MFTPSQHTGKRISGGLLLLVIFAAAWSGFGQRLLTRPLWMDELHSWLLITDSNADHAMSALADGADYNPPTYFLVARCLAVFGPVTEYRLRMLSLFFTAATALAVYLIFSRRYTAAASVGATLFAAGHQLMVLQSTETRFYALWVCLLMWYCWLLTKQVDGTKQQWVQRIALAVLAAAICTTHYFGVISVGLVTVAWIFCNRRSREAVIVGGGLIACCIVAVACCLPMLQGQRAALTCSTWVKPPTIASSVDYMWQFLPMIPFGLCCGAAFAGWISRQQPDYKETGETKPSFSEWTSENTTLVGLMLMPFVLIAFSWFVQPALVNRYATVAVFGMTPVYVWLLSRATEAIQNTCVGIAAFLICLSVHSAEETWDFNLQKHYVLQQRLAELPEDQVVVFEDRIDFWLLNHLQNEEHQPSWYQADFEADDLRRPSNLRTVQRDVGRRTEKWFPNRFPMKPMTDLARIEEFVVVPYVDKPFGELRFPDTHHATRLNDRLYRLKRKPILSAQMPNAGNN